MLPLPLSQKHHHQLKRFVRLVEDMVRCRFLVTHQATDQTIARGVDSNGVQTDQNPTYDKEDFLAFLTRYRQVGYNRSDRPSVNFKHVLDVADLYASDAMKQATAALRSEVFPFMEGKYSAFQFAKFDEQTLEPVKTLTSFQTFEALINGDFFHPDKKYADTIDFFEEKGMESWMYLWPVISEIIIPTLNGCMRLSQLLLSEGILTKADFPEACFPTTP